MNFPPENDKIHLFVYGIFQKNFYLNRSNIFQEYFSRYLKKNIGVFQI